MFSALSFHCNYGAYVVTVLYGGIFERGNGHGNGARPAATPTRAGQSAVGRGAVARFRAGRVSSGEDHDRATEDDRLEVERVGGEEQEGRVDCVPVGILGKSWEVE